MEENKKEATNDEYKQALPENVTLADLNKQNEKMWQQISNSGKENDKV